MAKTLEEIAAEEKARADADAAAKAAAEKGSLTPEERKAAEEKRAADEKALADKLAAAESRTQDLEGKIEKMREQLKANAQKGKDTQEIESRLADAERRLADSEKIILESHEREQAATKKSNQKTLETDLRVNLEGKVDASSMTDVIDLLILRNRARVDADGKVAILDENGKWGSLTPEAVLRHVPPALQLAKGVPGSGSHGPAGEVGQAASAWDRGKKSQKAFNEAVAKGELPSGDTGITRLDGGTA